MTTELKPAIWQQAAKLLDAREAELRALAASGTTVPAEADACDVLDFKDLAVNESEAVVAGIVSDHAGHELAQVFAARRRLAEGSYGLCAGCGEPIDERRLLALPAAVYCTECQAIHERTST